MKNTWKRNHGNLLLGCAVLSAVLVCGISYFKLVPRIELAGSISSNNVQRQVVTQRAVLLATIWTPPVPPDRRVTGKVMILSPEGQLASDTSPIKSIDFVVTSDGTLPVLMPDLARGNYCACAFLDLNENGQLDFDGESPAEPFRFATPTQSAVQAVRLADAIFTLQAGLATNLVFDFRREPVPVVSAP